MEETYFALNPWWEGREFDCGILRDEYLDDFEKFDRRKQVEVIVGSRRIGKTTIVKQMVKRRLGRKIPARDMLYLALDHPKLSGIGLSEHVRVFRKLFMHDRRKKLFLFLDEIQESPDWETELKSLYDTENLKIVCTGSTASLIKTQGGKLTGRQMISTIYPLNFKEFLRFRNAALSRAEEYKLERLVEEYLNTGGYPENVIRPSEEYLYTLINDIVARDIVRLYQVKKANLLRDLLKLLASAVGSRTSFNKLAHVLGLSVDTVKEYIGYLESAFLVKSLEKWTTSYSEKIYAYRKFYFHDTGLKTTLTGSGDTGFKAENAVFMHLCKKRQDLGYFAESEREVDFVTGTFRNPFPIEVKYSAGFDWESKKFAGMKLFLHRYPKVKKALVVTKDTETQTKEGPVAISTVPLWKYLLEGEIPIEL